MGAYVPCAITALAFINIQIEVNQCQTPSISFLGSLRVVRRCLWACQANLRELRSRMSCRRIAGDASNAAIS